MAREYGKRRSNPTIKVQGSRGFPLGLNELTHPSAIKNNELAECKNAIFDQNGVIKKRQGSKIIGTTRDVSNSKINGLQGLYKIGDVNFLLRIADDGIAQKFDETTETWIDIAGSPTFSNVRTYILQGYGYVYFMNSTDVMKKWDGTTWTTYTTITNPVTAPTLAKVSSGVVTMVNVANGGSGYAVGNILTPAGGDGVARFVVASVTGNVVTAVTISNGGSGYGLANGVATTVSPSGGSNCTVNLTQVKGVGPRTYSYKYMYFNDIGYTMLSSGATVTAMPNTLDNDTYVTVTIPNAAPAGAVNVGIFRGDVAGEEEYLTKLPATDLVYYDKGQDVPDNTFLIPTANSTSGYHFKLATIFKEGIVGITTEYGDDTIVFSGGAEAFDVFGKAEGGGMLPWRKGDGSAVTCLKPFKEELYVFKTNKIGAFKFDTTNGIAIVRDINLAIGSVSQDAVHEAGNDLRGYAYDGAFSLGNEPNFADVIRSKLLSPRVQKTVDSITRQDITGIVSTYFKNLSMWSIPMASVGDGNTAILVYDERYAAWSLWTGIKAACFTKFIDIDKQEHLYYGSAQNGNIYEMFTGTNDGGAEISFRIATKQFDMGVPYKYKTYDRAYLLFGLVSGADTRITMMSDTNDLVGTYPLYVNSDSVGFGTDEWGTMAFGETGTVTTDVQAGLIIRFIDLSSKDFFNIQTIIENNGLNDQLEIMGIFFEYAESERPLASSMRLTKL